MSFAAAAGRRSNRKAKGDGHLRRAEILAAADRIFASDGYDGATIRRIADEVGVSSTALYMHFPDKAAMLLEICNGAFKELADRNAEIAGRPVDAAGRVRMLLREYVRWALTHPSAYTLVYCRPRTDLEAHAELTEEMSRRIYDALLALVREVAAGGRLKAETPHVAAQALWMGCHGAVALMTSLPRFPWAQGAEEMAFVTLDALLDGLVAS